LAAVFVILFVAYCSNELTSNFLLLLFVGWVLLLLIHVPGSLSRRYLVLVVGLSLSSGAALLTHNQALVFVPTIVLVLLSDSSRRLLHRLVACAAVTIGGILPWVAMRMMLHQMNSHPLGSHPSYSFAAYLHQSVAGLGAFFSPTSRTPVAMVANVVLGIGFTAFVVWGIVITRRAERCLVRIPFLLASVAYLFLLIVFNLTWINDPLGRRYIWFLPLCIIPGICLLVPKRPVFWLLLLYPIVLGLPA
jgi:hypothetical protein